MASSRGCCGLVCRKEVSFIALLLRLLLVGFSRVRVEVRSMLGLGLGIVIVGDSRSAMVTSPDGVAPSRMVGIIVCLPLLIFPCTINSRSSLLAPAHPVVPEKGPYNGCGDCGVVIGWHRTSRCGVSGIICHVPDGRHSLLINIKQPVIR